MSFTGLSQICVARSIVLNESHYQRPELGPRDVPTLCNLCDRSENISGLEADVTAGFTAVTARVGGDDRLAQEIEKLRGLRAVQALIDEGHTATIRWHRLTSIAILHTM